MTTPDNGVPPALGFLTILEHDQHGLVGGYLILNAHGRPLEFHCTAPVKANRAQQILFGPTLESYLYGEQIGQTLLNKSSLELLGVCTDVERALSVRDYISLPVTLVLGREDEPAAQPTAEESSVDEMQSASAQETPHSAPASVWRVDAAHRAGPHLSQFAVGPNRLAVPAHRHDDREAIVGRFGNLSNFDLVEPFERIRQAVEEAHKTSRA